MIAILAYTVITGLLVRADGWGVAKLGAPKWHFALERVFSAYTCAVLFGLVSWVMFDDIAVAAVSAAAFALWRVPGFQDWHDWLLMFWRGWWPSLIGFTLLSLVAYGEYTGGLYALPFAAAYMLIYTGGHKWLPQSILGFNRHVWIEHASGWAFAIAIWGVL